MKTNLLRRFSATVVLVFCFFRLSFAQENSDYATYYYNNFETATAGSTSSLGSSSSNPNRLSTSTTLDASTTSPLEGTVSLSSKNTSAIGVIQWNFVGDGTSGINLNSNDWDWDFLYKNSSASSNDDPDVMTAGKNQWKYWIIGNSYAGNSTKGMYVTQVGTNLVLRERYNTSSNSGQYNTILTAPLPNDQQTHIIKVTRYKAGNYAIYIDNYVAGMSTASTLSVASTGGTNTSTYYHCFLEVTSTSAARFQFDKLDMYTHVLQFYGAYDTATNGITPFPLYAGQTNAVIYGVQLMARGNFTIQQLVFATSGAGFEAYFNSTATLYRQDGANYNTSNTLYSTSITLTGNSAQTYSINDSFATSGNTDGTLDVAGYYFIVGNVKSTLNYGNPPTGKIYFQGPSLVDGSAAGNDATFTYTSDPSTTVATSPVNFGTTYDWIGASSSNVSTSSNWSPSGVPTTTDAVRIGYIPYTGSKKQPIVSAGNFTVNTVVFGANNTPTLTINSGYKFTANNGITVNTGSTVKIVGPGIFNIDGASAINGNASFTIAPTGILSLNDNNSTLTVGSSATMTLASDTTGTATVAQIPSGGTAAINGLVTVQRFVQGSATYNTAAKRWLARGYRLLSSPVNLGLDGNSRYPVSLNYLALSTIITGCTSTLGTTPGNPSLYLFNEKYASNNSGFTTGNFKGVTDIHDATGKIVTSDMSSAKVYAGEGYMMYFRGDKVTHITGTPSKTSYPFVAPESVTFSTTGYLNQGTIPVVSWTGYGGLLYTQSANTSDVRGYNLVGNPYASSIDWSKFGTAAGSAILGVNIDPTIWIFNPTTSNYATYNAATQVGNGTTSIIPSGQGFFVHSNNYSSSLTFTEAAKTNTQVIKSNLLMGAPVAQQAPQLLRLKLITDTINYDNMVIGFSPTATSKFNGYEDSEYMSGSGAPETLYSYSTDSKALAINFLPLPKQSPLTIKMFAGMLQSGQYTLQRTALDAVPKLYDIWLMDNYKKDSLDIRNNSNYVFNVDINDTASYGANRFTIVIRQNPALGVHLLDFTATKSTGGVLVGWKTENEQNYTNFTVERSTNNGLTYDILGGQLSNAQGTYTFTDNKPGPSVNIYRLKIEDLNGTVTYSKTAIVTYGSANAIAGSNINVYPNPATSTINLAIKTGQSPALLSGMQSINKAPTLQDNNQSYAIKIVNITGTVVKTATSNQPTWQDNVSTLLPGTYIIQVVNNSDKREVGKTTFVKM